MDVTGEGQLAGEAKMGPQWTEGKEGGARGYQVRQSFLVELELRTTRPL